jgi:hypothetical protein
VTSPDLDRAMYTIWLHQSWFAVTVPMTTPEKEAAADAVCRHLIAGGDNRDELPDDRSLRWWRPQFDRNRHGVEVYRIKVGTRVEVLLDGARVTGEVVSKNPPSLLVSYAGRQAVVDHDDVVALVARAAAAVR